MDVFIGIDLGTSGCRGIAIDPQAEVVAQCSVELPASREENPGESRQQPTAWWDAVVQVLSALSRDCRGSSIRALAVDGTSSSLLLCDREGEPLTPGLMYDDTSARETVPRLERIAPPDSPVLTPSSSLAKLLLLSQGLDHSSFHAAHQADWIMGRLCGHYGLSDENNCLKLGYDPIERRWPDWFEALRLPPACLPQVFPCGTAVGTLSPPLANQLELTPEVRVVTGTTDANAAFLATGADRIGDAVTSLGSTLVLKILSQRPIFSVEHGVYSHRLGERWLVSGASNSGGAVCRAFFSDREMAEMTLQLNPQSPTGLDYYPLLRPGERFPLCDSDFPPRLSPRPESPLRFFQAVLEGITQIERQGYELLHRLGAPRPRRILTIGGGAVNEPWRQMRKAALGIPVARAKQQQAAYGAALLARQGFD